MRFFRRTPHICDSRPIERVIITPPTTEQIKSLADTFACSRNPGHQVQPVRVEARENSYHYFWNCVDCFTENGAIRNTYERIIKEAREILYNTLDTTFENAEETIEEIRLKLQEAEQYFRD